MSEQNIYYNFKQKKLHFLKLDCNQDQVPCFFYESEKNHLDPAGFGSAKPLVGCVGAIFMWLCLRSLVPRTISKKSAPLLPILLIQWAVVSTHWDATRIPSQRRLAHQGGMRYVFFANSNWVLLYVSSQGVCHEIFDRPFFHDSTPFGPLINRQKYFRIRFRRDIGSQSDLPGVQHTAEIKNLS